MRAHVKNFQSRLLAALSVLVFCAAVFVLYRQLAGYGLNDILQAIGRIPPARIGLAAVITLINYGVVAAYDILAFAFLGLPGGRRRIFFAAFVSDAVSNNVGYAMLSGGAARLRLYASLKVSPFDVAKVVLFASLTLWVGLLAILGIIFTFEPQLVPRALHLPFPSVRGVGLGILGLLLVYLALCAARLRPVRAGRLTFSLPSPGIAAGQVLVSSADWVLAALVLYVLLPRTALSFIGFLSIYLVAQFFAIISQVPGGLGVFESIIVIIFPRTYSSPEVFGPLIVFRAVYYLLPLAVALAALAAWQIASRKRGGTS